MFDVAHYSAAVAEILGGPDGGQRRMPLAPSGPADDPGLAKLRESSLEDLFDNEAIASREFAECTRSALFLYFSALDESHTISQGVHSPSGSFLHGIMHRQEPDYSNAKYWFRNTGDHELYPTLREDAVRLPLKDDRVISALNERKRWDPFWFIDAVEAAVGGDSRMAADLIEIQRLEWDLLFSYVYRRALAG